MEGQRRLEETFEGANVNDNDEASFHSHVNVIQIKRKVTKFQNCHTRILFGHLPLPVTQ